jgi:B12-binding domain/radical SAM domain protein of rhizo-twelve system
VKVALINPPWSFEGSIYFGCREPHLPLEFGYAKALLESRGHDVLLLDAHLEGLEYGDLAARLAEFRPEMSVITSAPSYLFWRCPPPELRVPLRTLAAIADTGGLKIAVGPHGSTTPSAVLRKLPVDAVVVGECEEALLELASAGGDVTQVDGLAYRASDGGTILRGSKRAVDMARLPALSWPAALAAKHRHHHHRFDREPRAAGAELEASRGCPYACTFCAKQNFRDKFRKRPLATVLQELDGLIAQGIEYVYFVDEIFLPDRALLEALAERPIEFGVQMRIDLFDAELLELLGRAGCVSIEAGVESVSAEGRSLLAKRCRLNTGQLVELLLCAKRHVPFVQANLLQSAHDRPEDVQRFRQALRAAGVWSNDPVPLFPYPGSPEYGTRWGAPDDQAWERAHEHYLQEFESFSDIQELRPEPLSQLERGAGA